MQKKKKRMETDYFRALHINGSGELANTAYSLEGMRKLIDESNEKSKRLGYKPWQYMIVHTEYYRYVDDDGMFLRDERLTQRVEIYPETLEGGANV